jgi:predicted NBD/HSP70 family sugar kinase
MPSPNTRMAAGVDCSGTKIQTAVLRDGEVTGSSRVRTRPDRRSAGI